MVTDRREIGADAFFTGLFETALDEGEIIREVRFPVPEAAAYAKFPNPASKFALVAVMVARTGGSVRLAVTGAAPTVFRVPEMESALAGSFTPDAIAGTRVSPGRHYFDCEGTILACYDPGADGDGHEARPNPDHIYLAVDDLDDCFARCRAALATFDSGRLQGDGSVLGEIAKRPWGELSFYIHDPFGNPICFVDRTTVFVG